MIVKYKTIKHPQRYSAKRVCQYVLEWGKVENAIDESVYLQNMDFIDPATNIHKSFLENYQFQIHRKNAVVMTHIIFSVHPDDREQITKEAMFQLRDSYIRLAGLENAVILGKLHEAKNYHYHLLVSGGAYRSEKRLRMSKAKMKTLLREFEAYQIRHFPELTYSIAYTNKKERAKLDIAAEDRNGRRERLYQTERRYEQEGKGRRTQKEVVKERVEKLFAESQSYEDLVEKIKEASDLMIYTYKGQIKGVISGRKYRFTSLGISKERIQKLEQVKGRLAQLKLLKETYQKRGRSR